ncbi:DUF99 family protein [Methanotrichaceae archaeon M04Ac]|uniref:UPF0215 protein P0O24_11685 n=1 Tax=Candidatus Methanocrinis alkalitolerans TaxID=3033395 RepID=A0ABT5XHP7_9EURY|nr:DUF99 family protein [Candidatus Methanocrinis alkalitolerans]MCR3884887.1 DUF99 family protein [Methanothrix sp.]MDF0594240.1 DUF99 family protein [Candidatus Methanocrinis alkalitolerans]
MKLHVNKKGVRVLGIAESFRKSEPASCLAGVVMRKDLRVDGFGFAQISVGGDDATEGVLEIFRGLDRRDINAVLLNGSVISWFNIVDLETVHRATDVPVVSLTYQESEGLDGYIREYFSEPEAKLDLYRELGPREALRLKTGFVVYVRCLGVTAEETKGLLNSFTLDGRVPEPLRVARLLARSAIESGRRSDPRMR